MREADHKLQVFSFGGKFFGEVRLTFGCSSSAGHFDDSAKLIKRMAENLSKIDPVMVNQVLDVIVACGAEGYGSVQSLNKAYRGLCSKVGVSLADESDPDKAFNASHVGKVLGIMYDLREWRWWLSPDKLVPILELLYTVSEAKEVKNRDMMTLNGKLTHYMHLVPGGCWQRGFLLRLQDSTEPPSTMYQVPQLAKNHAHWWLAHLRAAQVESSILDPRYHHRLDPVEIYTNAAGGEELRLKNWAGRFCPP